jgi:adenosylcobinamide-GDP ribazoletransferase
VTLRAWIILQVKLLVCAIQFLTRLPTPPLSGFQADWITRAARYFPLVGQLVGGLSAFVLLLSGQVWNSWIAAVLAIATGIALTGAFHEDGLADTADGLGGGQTVGRRLEIMKDSRVGTYGVVTLVVTLTLKVLALGDLSIGHAAWALLAAHGLARAAAVMAMRLTPYAAQGEASKWRPAPQGVNSSEAASALAFAIWPLCFLPGGAIVAGLTAGALPAIVLSLIAKRLIGGHTGDVLGGIEQVFEVGFLLGVAAILT